MRQVVLLLGGNLGDVEQTFAAVRIDLGQRVGEIKAMSTLLSTEAWGFESAPFGNQAVILETELGAEELLEELQSIEERWGRDRARERETKESEGVRYTARTIDIDIIFYGDSIIETPRLTVPHLLMAEREFVLEPIAQIAPRWVHPQSGKSVVQMLNELRN